MDIEKQLYNSAVELIKERYPSDWGWRCSNCIRGW